MVWWDADGCKPTEFWLNLLKSSDIFGAWFETNCNKKTFFLNSSIIDSILLLVNGLVTLL